MSAHPSRRSARVESDVGHFPPFARLDLVHAPPLKVEGKPRENVAERDARARCFAAPTVDMDRVRQLYDGLLRPAASASTSRLEPTRAAPLVALDPDGTLRTALDAALAARDARELWTLCEHAQLAFERRIAHVDTEYTCWWLNSMPSSDAGVAEVLDRTRADAVPLDLDGSSGGKRRDRPTAAAPAAVKEEEEEPPEAGKRARGPASLAGPSGGASLAPDASAAAALASSARAERVGAAADAHAERKRAVARAAEAYALAEAVALRVDGNLVGPGLFIRGTSSTPTSTLTKGADGALTRAEIDDKAARDALEALYEAAVRLATALLEHLSSLAWCRAAELGALLPAWATFMHDDVPAWVESSAKAHDVGGRSYADELKEAAMRFCELLPSDARYSSYNELLMKKDDWLNCEPAGAGSSLCGLVSALTTLCAAEQLPGEERRQLLEVVWVLAEHLNAHAVRHEDFSQDDLNAMHTAINLGEMDADEEWPRRQAGDFTKSASDIFRALRGCCAALECCVYGGVMEQHDTTVYGGAAAAITRIARDGRAAHWAMGTAARALVHHTAIYYQTSILDQEGVNLMREFWEITSQHESRGSVPPWQAGLNQRHSVLGHVLEALCVLFTDEDAPVVERVNAARAAGVYVLDINQHGYGHEDGVLSDEELAAPWSLLRRWDQLGVDAEHVEQLADKLVHAREAHKGRRSISAAERVALPPLALCDAGRRLLHRLGKARRWCMQRRKKFKFPPSAPRSPPRSPGHSRALLVAWL